MERLTSSHSLALFLSHYKYKTVKRLLIHKFKLGVIITTKRSLNYIHLKFVTNTINSNANDIQKEFTKIIYIFK